MAVEETLLLKVIIDGSQPAQSIEELEKRTKQLTKTLKQVPEEGTEAFNELAQSVSGKLGVSLDEAKQKIREFSNDATKQIQEGNKALTDFRKNLKQVPAAAGSIDALTKEVKSLEKEIKSLDTSTQEFADKSKQLKQLKTRLREVKQEAGLAGKTLSQALKDSALDSANFGKRLKGISKTIRTAFGFGAIRTAVSTLRGSLDSLIDKYKESSEAVATIDNDLGTLRTSIEGVAVSFIEANQEGISNFIRLLTSAIPVLQQNAGLILKVVAALALYINRQKIANGLTLAGRAATIAYNAAVKVLTGQIRITTVAQKALNGALRANPIGLIVSAIGVLIVAFTELFKRNETFRNSVLKITEQVKDFLFNNEALQSALQKLGGTFQQIIKFAGGIATVLAGVVAGVVDFIVQSGLLEAILNNVIFTFKVIGAIIQFTINLYNRITTAVKNFINSNETLKGAVDFVFDAFSRLAELFSNLPALFNGISAATTQLGKNITAFFKKVLLDAQILNQQVEKINPFGKSADQINQRISELRAQRQAISDETISIGQAFSDAYKNTVKEQEAFAKEQAKLQAEAEKRNKEIFAQFKARAQASASLSKKQRDSLKAEINATKELNAQQKQELNNLIQTTFERAKELGSAFDQLSNKRSELQKQIKALIAVDKDYSKQQEELAKVTAELTRIEEEFADATRFGESELKKLERTQKELLETIKESIATGEDYSEEQEELAETQAKLNKINEQFDSVVKSLNQSVRAYAEGSLSDYDEKIKTLQEEQKKVNIESERYIELTNEINTLTLERNRIQELLNTNTEEFAAKQSELNSALSESQATREATEEALNKIQLVTDATEEGAKEIERIEQELSDRLKQIQAQRIQSRVSEIDSEILALEKQRDIELEKFSDNESLKLAVEKEFQLERNQLLLEQNQLNAQLLQNDLENFKKTQAEKTEAAKIESEEQKRIFEQVVQATANFSGKLLDLISETQTAQFEKQKEALTQAEEATIKNAQQTGASEAKKQQIREEFAAKQEKLSREQASKEKSIALGRAVIEQSILIIKALQTPPAPNAIAGGIAAALAALQIATIAAQKFALGGLFDYQVQSENSKFARGAHLRNGAYHSQGGMPILNPYTGQKVAEIEKDEVILNRRSMNSKDVLTLSGTPLEIASELNSYKNYGVPFVRKKYKKGGSFNLGKKITQKGVKFAKGGSFGINTKVLKLQSGAVVASDIAREANQRFNSSNETNALLSAIVEQNAILIQTIETGFEETPSTAEELQQVAQLQQDENNAS